MEAELPPAALITLANEKQQGSCPFRFNLHPFLSFYVGAEENEFPQVGLMD